MTSGKPARADGGSPDHRPLRRDAERNRLRILASAREVFAARGVDVTLDDIAHHAGLGVGTVYRRYPSREALVEALFDEQINHLAELAEEGARHPDPWTGLTEFCTRSTELMATDRGLQDVLFSRSYGRDRVAKARECIAPAVDGLLERCQRAGVVRPDVVGADLVLLQFMTAAVIEYTEHTAAGLWQRYLTVILDGLRSDATPLPAAAPDAATLSAIAERWHPPRRQTETDTTAP